MFNVSVEPKTLKILKNEGYNFKFGINEVTVRTKEGGFLFEIIYNEDTYELFIFTVNNSFCYATSVVIEVDKINKVPILKTQAKHKDSNVYKTIMCN